MMKVIKATGLVPVHATHSAEIFGVTPEVARAEVAKGTLILVDIPDDYETIEVDGPSVDDVQSKKDEDEEVVEIPENWQSMQHLRRVKLAKDLYPNYEPETENKKWTVELADKKIQEEVDRRTAETPLV
jgi:hypothetical protein